MKEISGKQRAQRVTDHHEFKGPLQISRIKMFNLNKQTCSRMLNIKMNPNITMEFW